MNAHVMPDQYRHQIKEIDPEALSVVAVDLRVLEATRQRSARLY